MKTLNLKTTTEPQKVVKAFLEHNASDILAHKINNGVKVEKDGKTLVNKKTLDGFMKYATDEARKIAEKGSMCACVDDATVFSWAIHYFEEDSIIEKLYNEDGTEYVQPKAASTPKKADKKKDVKKPEQKAEQKPTVAINKSSDNAKKITTINQISFFDL